LAGDALPADIAEIAASLVLRGALGPAADMAYQVYVEQATGLAIGDGARVVQLPADPSHGRAQEDLLSPGMASGDLPAGWSRQALRRLLLDAFDDTELAALCFDHFPEVHRELTSGMSKGQMVQRLLEHCVRRDRVGELLARVREGNPVQYERYRPRGER
jgi:hypothetical protein